MSNSRKSNVHKYTNKTCGMANYGNKSASQLAFYFVHIISPENPRDKIRELNITMSQIKYFSFDRMNSSILPNLSKDS